MSDETTTKAVKIFYCYARKDKGLRDELERHLAGLKRSEQVIFWYDREILPGTEWKGEIHRHLDTSDIILLLISPNFIQSDYCYSIEMRRALERHKAGAMSVIPIILRPCSWNEMPIHALQALPQDGKPITTWRNRDEAFQNVVAGIREVVKRCFVQRLESVNADFQNHQKLQVSVEVNRVVVATYPLEKENMLVGRATTADIIVPHPAISRSIARIFWEGGMWKIMDTGAMHGLYFHGKRLNRQEILILVPGDVIELATEEAILRVQEEPHVTKN